MQVYKLNSNDLKFVNLDSVSKISLSDLKDKGLDLQNLYTPGQAAAEAKASGINIPKFHDEKDGDNSDGEVANGPNVSSNHVTPPSSVYGAPPAPP